MACSVGKVCTCTQLNDSVQYIEHKRKTRRDKRNTGCCWNKFSEFTSLESSKGVRGIQEEPGRQQESRRKRVAGTVAHHRFPPFLKQAWWYVFFSSVLVETYHSLVHASTRAPKQPSNQRTTSVCDSRSQQLGYFCGHAHHSVNPLRQTSIMWPTLMHQLMTKHTTKEDRRKRRKSKRVFLPLHLFSHPSAHRAVDLRL